jgi:hypothetical protein
MSSGRPSIPDALSEPNAWSRVRMLLRIILGQAGNAIPKIQVKQTAVSATYQQAEVTQIEARLRQLETSYNALLSRLDGPT